MIRRTLVVGCLAASLLVWTPSAFAQERERASEAGDLLFGKPDRFRPANTTTAGVNARSTVTQAPATSTTGSFHRTAARGSSRLPALTAAIPLAPCGGRFSVDGPRSAKAGGRAPSQGPSLGLTGQPLRTGLPRLDGCQRTTGDCARLLVRRYSPDRLGTVLRAVIASTQATVARPEAAIASSEAASASSQADIASTRAVVARHEVAIASCEAVSASAQAGIARLEADPASCEAIMASEPD